MRTQRDFGYRYDKFDRRVFVTVIDLSNFLLRLLVFQVRLFMIFEEPESIFYHCDKRNLALKSPYETDKKVALSTEEILLFPPLEAHRT